MSVLIKGITLDDFIRYGGEYAGYLDGTGCTVELPNHGDLIDRDAICIKGGRNCGKMFFAELLKNAPVVIPAERKEAYD